METEYDTDPRNDRAHEALVADFSLLVEAGVRNPIVYQQLASYRYRHLRELMVLTADEVCKRDPERSLGVLRDHEHLLHGAHHNLARLLEEPDVEVLARAAVFAAGAAAALDEARRQLDMESP